MIFKMRSIPLIILILEALLRRLPKHHPRYLVIQDEHRRRVAGYKGEESLDFYLRSLPDKKYFILHDLNLPDGPYNCQIDTALISSEYTLVIGVKQMAGNLEFDTKDEQFTQMKEGEKKGFPYPIAQEERHKAFIEKLLMANNFPKVPIDYLVTLTNPYATYSITGPKAEKVRPHVCKSDIFPKRIQMFENAYQTPCLTLKEMRKLSRLLVKMNKPPTEFFLEKYGIQRVDLRTGVLCPTPSCEHRPMIRKKRQWFCPGCGTYSKDAHIQALMDYFLLFSLTITNQQFRKFAHLASPDAAGRILRSLNLICSGSKKMRTYAPEQFPWDPLKKSSQIKPEIQRSVILTK